MTDNRNSVANTKELIDMINVDSLMKAKQHLGSLLAVVEAAELAGFGSSRVGSGNYEYCCNNKCISHSIKCANCAALQQSNDERLIIVISEPSWSNCVGCALK